MLAFAESRLRKRDVSEDVVQEAFIGFLNSLPNYTTGNRPLESYLFTIAAHKLTDCLRREGRRPALSLDGMGGSHEGQWQLPGPRTGQQYRPQWRTTRDRRAVAGGMPRDQVQHWVRRQDWGKLQCMGFAVCRGKPNQVVAEILGLSEQQVRISSSISGHDYAPTSASRDFPRRVS